jgi:hypothetical protein
MVTPLVFALALIAGVATAATEPVHARCATAQEIMTHLSESSQATGAPGAQPFGSARVSKLAAQSIRGRTYSTPHFAVHYTLAPGTNRPRFVAEAPGDLTLKAITDSLLRSITGLSTARRDSTLHAKLDSMGAPHSEFVIKSALYFARAWAHYDSLGMRMPDSSASLYFVAPTYGRVAIDIADIGTVSPPYRNDPYYGLAFPPTDSLNASILLENDFLYRATYNATSDQVTGTPIRSLHNGATYRDYSQAWDMGLKVTASHEFYHIIQYEYTPSLSGFHAWYELSATGMEERLAPEVNDYFQYLPFTIPHNHDTSLLTKGTLANYGNAIFHVFLTRALGAGFDRVIWEKLGENNNLPSAFVHMAGSTARWDSLLTAYGAALSIAGTPGSTTSPLAFSPDMAQWPAPHFDTVPASRVSQIRLEAMTYRLIRPPVADTAFINLVDINGARRVDSTGTGYTSALLPTPNFTLTKTPGLTRTAIVAVNSSFTDAKQVLMSKRGVEPAVTINPISRTKGPLYLIAPTAGATDSLRVVSQSGRHITTIASNSSGDYWRWDLKDKAGKTVPSGLYLMRRLGQTPLPILILP